MTNPYFSSYSPLPRRQLARAEALNAIFDAIIVGFNGIPDATALNQDRLTYCTDTGGAGAYVITPATPIVSYIAGQRFSFIATHANVGASTVNVSALGVKTIKRQDGTDLQANDITVGRLIWVQYDGTNFQLMSMNGSDQVAAAASAAVAAVNANTAILFSVNAGISAATATAAAASITGVFTLAGGAFFVGVTSPPASFATNTVSIVTANKAAFTAQNTCANGAGPAGVYSSFPNSVVGDTSGTHFAGINSGSSVFLVRSDGNVTNQNNSYGATSDRKLKQDIEPAGSQWNDVKAIAGQMSTYLLRIDPDGPRQLGIVAQDLLAVSPGLVETIQDRGEDGELNGEVTLSVKTTVMLLKGFKALGEALIRIEALEGGR